MDVLTRSLCLVWLSIYCSTFPIYCHFFPSFPKIPLFPIFFKVREELLIFLIGLPNLPCDERFNHSVCDVVIKEEFFKALSSLFFSHKPIVCYFLYCLINQFVVLFTLYIPRHYSCFVSPVSHVLFIIF